MPTDHANLEAFAHELADAARTLALRYFRTAIDVQTKADASPVTRADREIEARLRSMVADRYPDHGFLGEEEGGELVSGSCWVVDPIDGTKSFICGVPLFGVLIALVVDGSPILGVIEMPALGERWVGQAGGTEMNGIAAHASPCTALAQARLFATSPDMFLGRNRARFDALAAAVRLTRFGTDCYAYGLLALGHCDLVVEDDLEYYDVIALVPVIENAGGMVTDWDGNPIDARFNGQMLAAATPALHAQAMAVLRAVV